MKKNTICLIGIVIVLLICIIAYFKPLSLLDIVSEDNQISIIWNEFKISNGEPSTESIAYQDITAEQKSAVLALLEKFNYSRTFDTLFSNGTIETGDRMLSIYVHDDSSQVDIIVLTSSGNITINDRSYSMKNAERLIEQIIEIME